MLKSLSCAVAIACACSALPAMAACPDYVTAANPPALSGPARKGFANFGNTILAGLYKPWHMAHDVIVKAGQAATITGKFDYDAVLHKDLEGEKVHAYLYGTGMQQWQYLGSFITDSDGKVNVPLGVRPVGDYAVRFVVEGT